MMITPREARAMLPERERKLFAIAGTYIIESLAGFDGKPVQIDLDAAKMGIEEPLPERVVQRIIAEAESKGWTVKPVERCVFEFTE